ncbi:SCO family protein [Neptunicoccus cionae]|uniref:Electron transporter SenC n=1 Tax=Neptunicoccus cionae TaxID=2035344 RepID=A0A916R1N8_9RHOB|nr:SCO family protein [Amylibacter cionae]GGA27205.1 electron transporter SenC [Amylibacter cionae]
MTFQRKHYAILGLWVVALIALGLFVWARFAQPGYQNAMADVIGPGDYELVTTSGESFTQDSLKGRPSAVFFGFTHCPDVCPTSLGDIATWQEELGADNQIRVFFITVDPERDTVENLKDYVGWVPDAVGVSGSPEEVEKAVKAFKIYARKVPQDDGYTMDHSSNVLLFDANGRFFEPVGYQESFDRAVAKIRRMQRG